MHQSCMKTKLVLQVFVMRTKDENKLPLVEAHMHSAPFYFLIKLDLIYNVITITINGKLQKLSLLLQIKSEF